MQLFLSLTNLFHAHALPRALTTSAETALTVVGLYYWRFPQAGEEPKQRRLEKEQGGLVISLVLAALAFVLRPTNAAIWVVLGLYHLSDQLRISWRAMLRSTVLAAVAGCVPH